MAPDEKANSGRRATGSRASAHPTAPLRLKGITRDGTPLCSMPDYERERVCSKPRRRQPEWRHPKRHFAALRA